MMDVEPSVHDNFILSYCVDAENKEICLHTEYQMSEEPEYTDIVFTGVATYYFEGDDFISIILDVEETTLEDIYESYQPVFERLEKYSWPTNTASKGKDELLKSMHEQGVKGFEIHSTIGLSGWVWAQRMVKHLKS